MSECNYASEQTEDHKVIAFADTMVDASLQANPIDALFNVLSGILILLLGMLILYFLEAAFSKLRIDITDNLSKNRRH